MGLGDVVGDMDDGGATSIKECDEVVKESIMECFVESRKWLIE